MPLPVVPLDSDNEKQHRNVIATVLNELAKQAPSHGGWTATILGSGTAGTYEITSQFCRYSRIGRRVWLDMYIELAGAITGGGTGTALINGAPYAKAANTLSQGSLAVSTVNYTAGGSLSLSWSSTGASSSLVLVESVDTAAVAALAIGALAATSQIRASISYETDDP